MRPTFDARAGRATADRDDAAQLVALLEAVISERLDTVQALDSLTATHAGYVNHLGVVDAMDTLGSTTLSAAQARLTDLTRAQVRLLDRLAAVMPPLGDPI